VTSQVRDAPLVLSARRRLPIGMLPAMADRSAADRDVTDLARAADVSAALVRGCGQALAGDRSPSAAGLDRTLAEALARAGVPGLDRALDRLARGASGATPGDLLAAVERVRRPTGGPPTPVVGP
jgi:hypothetical protein